MYIHIKNQNGQAIWENQGHAETLNKISRAVQLETFYEVFTKAVLKMNKTASLEREPFLRHHSTQLDLFPVKPFLKRNSLARTLLILPGDETVPLLQLSPDQCYRNTISSITGGCLSGCRRHATNSPSLSGDKKQPSYAT